MNFYKILVIGEKGSGKSSLIEKWKTGKFTGEVEDVHPTVDQTVQVQVNDEDDQETLIDLRVAEISG